MFGWASWFRWAFWLFFFKRFTSVKHKAIKLKIHLCIKRDWMHTPPLYIENLTTHKFKHKHKHKHNNRYSITYIYPPQGIFLFEYLDGYHTVCVFMWANIASIWKVVYLLNRKLFVRIFHLLLFFHSYDPRQKKKGNKSNQNQPTDIELCDVYDG